MKLTKCIPAALLILLIASACKDDDNSLKVQAHNDNEMMSIMHAMSTEMDAMQMTGDADDDFATMMIMHHTGAINMANKELEKGDVAELKTMAQTMIDMQKAEIQELQTFLNSHIPESSDTGMQWGMEADAAMANMKNDADLQVITGDTDNDFAALMIQHHRSATEMAQSLLHHGHHDELKTMANKMIEDQNMEIQKLQEWLLKNKSY
ncbi:MAG: DUF305 domain-containing protein [Flavobacterium psychrophilum]|nr:MAG: DUF305 domain-containing protein [Flavobacterium psychrophilum]